MTARVQPNKFVKKEYSRSPITERKNTFEKQLISPQTLFRENKINFDRGGKSESRLQKGKLKPLSMEHFYSKNSTFDEKSKAMNTPKS